MDVYTLLVLLAVIGTSATETEEAPRLFHRLKRQASSLEPIPYTSRQYAPLPYQQGQGNGGPSASDFGDSSNAGRTGGDYTGAYLPAEDDVEDSSDETRTSFSSRTGADHSSSLGSRDRSRLHSSGRPYYEYQPPISTGRRIPTQTHVAGSTRYTFTQPSRGVRRQNGGRVYSYPFSGGRAAAGVQAQDGGAEPEGEGGDGGVVDSSSSSVGSSSVGSSSVSVVGGAGGGPSVGGDEEPLVQVFPSERPVVNPVQSARQQQQYQQRLRQLQQERQRRRQRQQAGGYGSVGGQRRPIYTGSQPLGRRYGQQPGLYRPGGQRPLYTTGQQPYYGGQFLQTYGGQQPYYNYGYSQGGLDTSGYDSECPNTGVRIQINGIPCDQAVDRYGSYLCYRHEYTSRECCLKCRGLKNPARVGCEYGDHSGRCQQLQPYDCYDLRNRQSCCQACERLRVPGGRSGCEYGDMTPNCERVRQNPGLCYIPENRYLCCETCNTIRVTQDPACPWGDQNAELCQPFDRTGNIRINCYAPPIKRICCQACQRLQDWIPVDEPGCEYGDRPVTFNTGMHRNLNCTSFMRYYGYEQCNQNQAVATNCCYTCHRYLQG